MYFLQLNPPPPHTHPNSQNNGKGAGTRSGTQSRGSIPARSRLPPCSGADLGGAGGEGGVQQVGGCHPPSRHPSLSISPCPPLPCPVPVPAVMPFPFVLLVFGAGAMSHPAQMQPPGTSRKDNETWGGIPAAPHPWSCWGPTPGVTLANALPVPEERLAALRGEEAQ